MAYEHVDLQLLCCSQWLDSSLLYFTGALLIVTQL